MNLWKVHVVLPQTSKMTYLKQKKSLRKGRNVWEGSKTEYVGRNIIIRRKGVKSKSKGYKLDGIVLMMKKKDIKQ